MVESSALNGSQARAADVEQFVVIDQRSGSRRAVRELNDEDLHRYAQDFAAQMTKAKEGILNALAHLEGIILANSVCQFEMDRRARSLVITRDMPPANRPV